MAATLRLPQDLDEKLSSYCTRIGGSKNRVITIALRAYLDDAPPPWVMLDLQEPDHSAFAGERPLRGRSSLMSR